MRIIQTAILAIAVAAASASADVLVADREQSYQGMRFVCTGTSLEARAEPRWGGYPLRLVFAQAGGQYIADVATTVRDMSGRVVLEASCPSPWLLVDLAPGVYKVAASARGAVTRTAVVRVPAHGQASLVLRFPDLTT